MPGPCGAAPQAGARASGRPARILALPRTVVTATPPEPRRRRHPTVERHGNLRDTNMEEAMANIAGYTRLPDATREQTLAAARKQAEQAAEHYAQLLATEAGIAARAVYPAVARLMFRLADDVFGSSATLVAAYTAKGRQLWHIDIDDEWPDESVVTDHLAAAADWCDDYFEAVDAGDGDELYVLDLDE